jgi:hypothetical protein
MANMKQINFMIKKLATLKKIAKSSQAERRLSADENARRAKNIHAELRLQDLKWKAELRMVQRKYHRLRIHSILKCISKYSQIAYRVSEKSGLSSEEAETFAQTRQRMNFTCPPPSLKQPGCEETTERLDIRQLMQQSQQKVATLFLDEPIMGWLPWQSQFAYPSGILNKSFPHTIDMPNWLFWGRTTICSRTSSACSIPSSTNKHGKFCLDSRNHS